MNADALATVATGRAAAAGVHVYPTTDMDAVAAVMRHPACWPWVHDATTPPDWRPRPAPGRTWLLAAHGAAPAGAFRVDDGALGAAVIHIAFLPGQRGATAAASLRALFGWARARGLRRLYGAVARDNRRARMLVCAAGMRRLGTAADAILYGKEVA